MTWLKFQQSSGETNLKLCGMEEHEPKYAN
jgi:hypothetical protein